MQTDLGLRHSIPVYRNQSLLSRGRFRIPMRLRSARERCRQRGCRGRHDTAPLLGFISDGNNSPEDAKKGQNRQSIPVDHRASVSSALKLTLLLPIWVSVIAWAMPGQCKTKSQSRSPRLPQEREKRLHEATSKPPDIEPSDE